MNKTEQKQSTDTYSYKGWIISDSFIKRCFGVFGHYLVANLIVSAVLMLIGLIFVFTIGGFFLSNAAKHGETYFERGDDGLSFEFGSKDEDDDQVFCMQDASRCPDGSYVSRTGPNCTFAACPEFDESLDKSVNYNEPFKINLNERVMFTNGMVLTLTSIDDQQCSPDVQCIWEGEYRVTFDVISPVDDVRTVTLGSVREKEQEHWGYTFTLQTVSDDQVEMVVVL